MTRRSPEPVGPGEIKLKARVVFTLVMSPPRVLRVVVLVVGRPKLGAMVWGPVPATTMPAMEPEPARIPPFIVTLPVRSGGASGILLTRISREPSVVPPV